MKRMMSLLLPLIFAVLFCTAFCGAEGEEKELKILFTHDIHSYFITAETVTSDGRVLVNGGAARLKTLLDENLDENTIYLDAGDFSMGTMLQAGYSTDAYELRLLGLLGCTATTFGNHEFDQGGYGAAKMLRAGLTSGDPLPLFLCSNLDFSGTLTDEQQTLQQALKDYGASDAAIVNVNGLKVGLFGLLGLNGIEDSPTSGMRFINYIEAAKTTARKLKDQGADLIVCLSHSGTDGDGANGEDIELAKAVPEINVIISGHSHSAYAQPALVGGTFVASCGEYLANLGSMTLTVANGKVTVKDYRLIPCDETVSEDAEIAGIVEKYKQSIRENYLADEDCDFDQVICRSEFDFMTLDEMYATHQEYPLGNLIADSYLYEARRNGINDIDVALVGLGTIRGAFPKGDITVAEAFEICSLGVGADGSAGHPILACWITGKELKLLVQLDASLGAMVSSIKMSYAGLRYTFNTERLILDRAYDIRLVREDGSLEEIEDGRMYKVACNMYAANMLGMLNGLTKGILSIVPKAQDGTPVENKYDFSLINEQGKEIKEWVAFKNYLSSFPEKDGVPTIPERYATQEGRKEKISVGGFMILAQPGLVTWIVIILVIVILTIIVILTHKKRKTRRVARREAKKTRKAVKKA